MKKFFRIFAILFIIVAIVLTSGYVYLVVKGKDLIVARLEKQLGTKVSFGAVGVSYPLTIRIDQINIEGYGTAKRAFFSLSLPYLLFKEVHFSKIEVIEPNIVIRRQQGDKTPWLPFLEVPQAPAEVVPPQVSEVPVAVPQVPAASEVTTPPAVSTPEVVTAPQAPQVSPAPVETKKEQVQKFDFFARKTFFRNGSVEAVEVSPEGEKLVVSLKNANIEIDRVSFPVKRSVKTEFNVAGILSGFDGRLTNEKLTASGWADFYKKDMKAQMQLTGMNGQVGLTADLVSVKNDMTVKGKMSLAFQSQTLPSKKEKSKSFEDFFVQTLQSSGMDVNLKFQFKTKMDKFDVGEISISGEVKKNE